MNRFARRVLIAIGAAFVLHALWGLEFLRYETQTTFWDIPIALFCMLGPFAYQGFRAATLDPDGSGRTMVMYLLVGVGLAPVLWFIMAVLVVAWAAATHQIHM